MSKLKDLVLKLATEFINIPGDSLEDHIYKTLGMAGISLSMDRAYLFEYDLKKGTMTNTYEWCAPGVAPYKSELQDLSLDAYPDWVKHHFSGQMIRIPSVERLPKGNLRNVLTMQGIKSLITVPLMDDGVCLGFVGFDAVSREIHWNEDHISLAKMIAEIYRNVIKRRDMERRLAATQRQYEELVEGLPVGLYRRKPGPGGEFIMVNSAMAHMFGYEKKEELLGVSIARFCVDMEKMKMCSAELATTGEIKEKEVRFSRRNGDVFWAAISAKEYFDDQGNALYVEGLVQDISERKRQEEEKERLRGQLQQAQRLESIGRLAGGVAHDFNNLLVPIIGYSELLMDTFKGNEQVQKYAAPIKEAGEKARDIVRQLLAFGRKQALEKAPVDLREHVLGFGKFLRHTLRDDIEVVVTSKDRPLVVECDVRQIDQVLLNLAINAQDAMPDGGRLEIEIDMVEIGEQQKEPDGFLQPGTYASVLIRDSGLGMDQKTLQQIFEPFFTTKPIEQGTGLGLAMAYGIVQQHGGSIKVESKPGQGTSFHVFLPLCRDCRGKEEKSKAPRKVAKGREKILLVEDEPAVRDFVAQALEKTGYQVIKAANYQEITDKFKELEHAPELLLTDVVMPGLSGIAIYEKLKTEFPGLKVLYMSGNAPESVSLDGEKSFLQKPFSLDRLAAAIREVLDGKSSEESAYKNDRQPLGKNSCSVG